MALSATSLYYLRVDQLRAECVQRGLSCGGSVQLLRRRLRDFISKVEMGGDESQERDQSNAPVDADGLNFSVPNGSAGRNSLGMATGNYSPVLFELVKQVTPLLSEKPEDILHFFLRMHKIHRLGLAEDRVFITLMLPLVPAGILQFLGDCLRDGNTWVICKAKVVDEYFPHFVRERLIRELIVFNFHSEGQSIRAYFDLVFQTAEFFQYQATEQQLVQRVIMNLHPNILNLAGLVDKPRSRKELAHVVNLRNSPLFWLKERKERKAPPVVVVAELLVVIWQVIMVFRADILLSVGVVVERGTLGVIARVGNKDCRSATHVTQLKPCVL